MRSTPWAQLITSLATASSGCSQPQQARPAPSKPLTLLATPVLAQRLPTRPRLARKRPTPSSFHTSPRAHATYSLLSAARRASATSITSRRHPTSSVAALDGALVSPSTTHSTLPRKEATEAEPPQHPATAANIRQRASLAATPGLPLQRVNSSAALTQAPAINLVTPSCLSAIADPASDQRPEPPEGAPAPLEISFPRSPAPSPTTGPAAASRLPPEVQLADASEVDKNPANLSPFQRDAPRARPISSAPLLVAAEPFDATRRSPVSSVSPLPPPDAQKCPNQPQLSDSSKNDKAGGSLGPSSRHQFVPSPALEDATNNNLDLLRHAGRRRQPRRLRHAPWA